MGLDQLLISKGELVYNGTVDQFTAEAKIAKKIIYRYKHDAKEHEIMYEAHELSSKLSEIMKQGEVADLKTEEVDFEEIIHRFLAKESGLL